MISGVPAQTITTNLGATATIVNGMISYATNSLDYLPAGVTATESIIGTGLDLAMITIAVPEGQAAWSGPVTVSGVATATGRNA